MQIMHVALSNCLQVLLSPVQTFFCGKPSIDTVNQGSMVMLNNLYNVMTLYKNTMQSSSVWLDGVMQHASA